ncbi:MAG TPA: hypothetical protein VIM09_02635 [Chthoniobacterales bacterium]
MKIVELQKNPAQGSRLRRENLIHDIKRFRRGHPIHSEVVGMSGRPSRGGRFIEDLRIQGVIDATGPDKKSVDLIGVRGDESQLRSQPGDIWSEQCNVKSNCGETKTADTNCGTNNGLPGMHSHCLA